MDDSWNYGSRKETDFAQQFGGGYLNEINFSRSYSDTREAAANAAARDILTACGTPDGTHQTKPEYMDVWNAVAKRFGRPVAEWLNNWSWLDSYAIGRAIMATNADHFAA